MVVLRGNRSLMNFDQRVHLEQQWHESEDFARDENPLIVGVYASSIFHEAEQWHLNALGAIADLHILDYGCGTGGTTGQLLERGARVTGFDISLTRLHDAQQRTQTESARFLQSAAEFLPFADHSFDAVLGKQILHHLDLTIAIPEIFRVLRPGGQAVFLEPLIHNPILEGYRRLTPHLRSPTERALSMADIAWIGSHFRSYQHREFILFSILPVLLGAVTGQRESLHRWKDRLQNLDRVLMEKIPFVGRYCWETVIVLER